MESELISWLRQRLPGHPQLLLGPGDDAAILRLAGRSDCVVTTDLLTDGVDFVLGESDPLLIGRKALAVNLSDLAAMAAKPLAAVIALALPAEGGMRLAKNLYAGMLPLAERFNVCIAGGDTNAWNGPLVISITAIGATTEHGPLRRDGAKVGDEILVTGSFGGSFLRRQFVFEPRVEEALFLNSFFDVHAAIDVSDGLTLDLSHVSRESHCGVLLDLAEIPVHPDAETHATSLADGSTALDHALSDGEDFELVLAVEPESAQRLIDDQPLKVPLTRIGVVIEELGLWSLDDENNRRRIEPSGFQHQLSE